MTTDKPEDWGHGDCSVCDEARAARAVAAGAETTRLRAALENICKVGDRGEYAYIVARAALAPSEP